VATPHRCRRAPQGAVRPRGVRAEELCLSAHVDQIHAGGRRSTGWRRSLPAAAARCLLSPVNIIRN